MASRDRMLRYLAAGLLAAFCLAFARTDTTEKSMVRAVLLEPSPAGWTVGLLYQSPEGAADSSEVSDGIRFAAAEGESLARAVQAAEDALPLEANFRLCDYLLLMPGAGWDAVEGYEALVLARQWGRTSARTAACAFTCAELSEATGDEGAEGMLTRFLQALKQGKKAMPRLYEARTEGALLLPVFALGPDGPLLREEGLYLSAGGAELWDAQRTACCRLLTGRGETFTFWLGGRPLILRRPLVSVEAEGEGFAVHIVCQAAPGSEKAGDGDLEALGALCTGLLARQWDAGRDLLGLGAYRALRDGGAPLQAAKNACPPLRTDVKVY